MKSNTIYDDVFRTLLNDSPRFLIPVVNEIFKTSYGILEKAVLSNNELYATDQSGRQAEKITDSCFSIGGTLYHIECQSTPDAAIGMRMVEYDMLIAIREMKKNPSSPCIRYPRSAVLYLRSTRNTPSVLEIPVKNLEEHPPFRFPVLKVTDWTLKDLVDKEMYFLIPFYFFHYESWLAACEADEEKLKELSVKCQEIVETLDLLCNNEKINEFEKAMLLEMSGKVAQALSDRYAKVKERIGDIMGGKVLEYEAKTILNRGRAEGKAEGKAEGQTIVFLNMIDNGFSQKDAQRLSELSDAQVSDILKSTLDKTEKNDYSTSCKTCEEE